MPRISWSLRLLTCAGAALSALHCGDDPQPLVDAGTPDSGVAFDTGVVTDSGIISDSGVHPDTGVDGGTSDSGFVPDSGPADSGDDGNNSFATAEAVTPNIGVALTRVIDVPGDRDFFHFVAPANSWIAVTTSAGVADTVIRLYDTAMTQLAENDDGNPGVNTNSEVIYFAKNEGTYYIEVMEYSDWAGDTPVGDATYRYQIRANFLDPAAQNNVLEDPETGDTEASAVALEMPNNGGILLGRFDGTSDVDWYRLTIPAGTNLRFLASLMPTGSTGYGSTPIGRIDLLTSSSTIPIGRVDQSLLNNQISVPLPAGDYFLSLAHPGTALEPNPFYVLKLNIGGDSIVETNEAANDTLAGAEAVTLVDDGTGLRRAYHLSTLGDGDVDYYAFDTLTGEVISVFCGARNSGSGVIGMTAEIRSAADATLATATETTRTDALAITAFTPPVAAARYFIRLSKTRQSYDVSGQWGRCQFRSAPP